MMQPIQKCTICGSETKMTARCTRCYKAACENADCTKAIESIQLCKVPSKFLGDALRDTYAL